MPYDAMSAPADATSASGTARSASESEACREPQRANPAANISRQATAAKPATAPRWKTPRVSSPYTSSIPALRDASETPDAASRLATTPQTPAAVPQSAQLLDRLPCP